MRPVDGADWCGAPTGLPPAIRPGLHCGSTDKTGAVTLSDELPPAIRPGLHCGVPVEIVVGPLTRDFPRPSGRGSIAAPR